MARKSNAEVAAAAAADAEARVRAVNEEAERRIAAMLPGLMAGLLAELGKVRSETGMPAPAGGEPLTTKSVLEGLAHAMAKASDPANRRRILPPEVMEEREAARKEMTRLILTNHAKGTVPVYKVLRTTFLNETLIQPQFFNPQSKAMDDQEIDWPGVPNQAMWPVDEAAQEVHAQYLKSIGAKAGHIQTGLKLEGDNIEPQTVRATDLPAPFVLSGKEIRRGHAGAPRGAEMAISDALAADPRRGNPAARPKVQHVLGTTAPPAVVS